ncbi:MAG TPA: hypothetical protein VLL54_21280 [Pyrinomonadaceae bacterium]|nr:hypothetical protein [Pyrinomonadaceae bacterium]
MRHLILLVLVSLVAASIGAQTQKSAAERAAELRAQLVEVEAKQTELQTTLKDLDEQMKPENIEHSLAGFGSTKPEDLREQRRKQLEIERNSVQAQLNLLNTSHTRLEAAIVTADAEAYRQSALPTSTTTPVKAVVPPPDEPIQQTTVPAAKPRQTKKKKARRARRTHHVATLALPRGLSLLS